MTHNRHGQTRRQFLTHTAGAAVGISGILQWRQPPAVAQERELSMLSWNHFVPASDVELKKQAEQFGRQQRVKVRLDFIAHLQLPSKLAAEVQTQAGHDIVLFRDLEAALHQHTTRTVTDLCDELGKKHGGWWDFARQADVIDGEWKAIPWFYVSSVMTYREDYFAQVGESAPDSYDDLLRAGRKLKKIGHPIGFAISQTTDSNSTLYPILWCYGASIVAEDGKTITINSPQTVEAIEYVKTLYHDCMEPEVLSWDDASNNRFILAGKGSWTRNAISIYETARQKNPEMAKQINHTIPPKGPARRLGITPALSLAIWKFSKNQDLAKDFLRFLFDTEQYNGFIEAGAGFNQPFLKAHDEHPIWSRDPKLKALIGFANWSALSGWPGPPTRGAPLVFNSFIIPNMCAKAVGGMPTKDAVAWAEQEIKKAYAGA
ncbi:MAG: extracellular solute-binding protein [Nitrospinae bacterium]|nr:extracellular solute-binding protein [Nitrospinota bacterium]